MSGLGTFTYVCVDRRGRLHYQLRRRSGCRDSPRERPGSIPWGRRRLVFRGAMADPWFRMHANVGDLTVVHRLANSAGIPLEVAVGYLAMFWGAASQHCPGGVIADRPDSQLEGWARWRGEPGKFAEFIRTHHATDGVINGWADYNGHMEARRRADRERKAAKIPQESVRNSSGIPAECVRTSTRVRNDTIRDITTKTTTLVRQKAPDVSEQARALAVVQGNGHALEAVALKTTVRVGREAYQRAVAGYVFRYWQAKTGHESAVLDPKRAARILVRLKEAGGPRDLLYAIDGAVRNDWLMGRDPKSVAKYDGVQHILRDREQVERLAGEVPAWVRGDPHPQEANIPAFEGDNGDLG